MSDEALKPFAQGQGAAELRQRFRRRHPDVWLSVSVTTRAPRPGETDGVEYHFVDQAEYDRMVDVSLLGKHTPVEGVPNLWAYEIETKETIERGVKLNYPETVALLRARLPEMTVEVAGKLAVKKRGI